MASADEDLQAKTLRVPRRPPEDLARPWVVTVVHHPDLSRVGERAVLGTLAETAGISRATPSFQAPAGGSSRPLGDPFLSRARLDLLRTPAGLRFHAPAEVDAAVAGRPLLGARDLLPAEWQHGVVIELGGRVVLLLHQILAREPDAEPPPTYGMTGNSDALLAVRARIASVAALDTPVLIRGETGTGKELAARAIAAHSRFAEPFISVNVSAIPATLAAAELFGAVKGSHATAASETPGYFGAARNGTLFLDEIGDLASDLQPLLLRALESGEVQKVGRHRPEKVNVRVIAATDARLEQAIASGDFRQPLLQRLARFEITIPPLRERIADLGLLLVSILAREAKKVDADRLLAYRADDPRPWLPPRLVGRLARYDWPGNVRELENVITQLVIECRGLPEAKLPESIERRLPPEVADGPSESVAAREAAPAAAAAPADVTDLSKDGLLALLETHDDNVTRAAGALGISRTTLYSQLRKLGIRVPGDIPEEELLKAWRDSGESLERAATLLGVPPKRALRIRLTQVLRRLGEELKG